jgi:LacI family transcriptional regulator
MVDIAKVAGCSQATVSLVLNNVTGVKISTELKAKVLDAARALNYGSQLVKRPVLDGPKDGCIGFIVDQLATTPEAVNAIEGARQESWSDNVTILACQTMSNVGMEARALDHLLRAGVSGIIFMSIFTRQIALSKIFDSLPVPLVLLNCYEEEQRFPAVVPDEIAGGARATNALIRQGHSLIATITGERFMSAAQDRLRGYRRALKAAAIESGPELVVDGNWTPSSGYEAMKRLLGRSPRPTAVFCQNDKMAWGAYMAIIEAGLSVPHDISIVGYDDDDICRHLRPQLTTVELPHRAMGAWAIRQLSDPTGGSTSQVVKSRCELIDRESTAAPKSKSGS